MCNNTSNLSSTDQTNIDLGLTDLGLTDATRSDAGHACTCCAGAATSAQPIAVGDSSQTEQTARTEQFLVTGMTCAHCVASVTEEVSAVAGVESVDVELSVGGESVVTVVSSGPISADEIRDAVAEAGYALVK